MSLLTLFARKPVALWRLLALGGALGGGMLRFWINPRHRRDAHSKARWLQGVCSNCLKAMRVEVTQQGTCTQGAFIASNHLSYLDILVYSSLTPVVFVAKKEVRQWPIFGWFAEKSGTRFIDRSRKGDVLRIAEELSPLLSAGISVIVFLEGTSTDGSAVLPFKSSLLEPAIQGRWPVVPAAIRYHVPPPHRAELEVCWWGEMTLPPHLTNLASVPWVQAGVAWGHARTPVCERKELAQALHEEVVTLKAKI